MPQADDNVLIAQRLVKLLGSFCRGGAEGQNGRSVGQLRRRSARSLGIVTWVRAGQVGDSSAR